MKAWRAALLRFDEAGAPVYDDDGFLLVGPDAQGRQVVPVSYTHLTLPTILLV